MRPEPTNDVAWKPDIWIRKRAKTGSTSGVNRICSRQAPPRGADGVGRLGAEAFREGLAAHEPLGLGAREGLEEIPRDTFADAGDGEVDRARGRTGANGHPVDHTRRCPKITGCFRLRDGDHCGTQHQRRKPHCSHAPNPRCLTALSQSPPCCLTPAGWRGKMSQPPAVAGGVGVAAPHGRGRGRVASSRAVQSALPCRRGPVSFFPPPRPEMVLGHLRRSVPTGCPRRPFLNGSPGLPRPAWADAARRPARRPRSSRSVRSAG